MREVMTALIRHMHDFAREVKLTTEEYLAACDFMVRAGHMSDDKRNEVVLAHATSSGWKAWSTSSPRAPRRRTRRPPSTRAHTPPFSARSGARTRPTCPMAPRSSRAGLEGESVLCKGGCSAPTASRSRTPSSTSGRRAPNGLYEQQDPSQPDYNLRGQFRTDAEGRYAFRAWRRWRIRFRSTARRAICCK